MAFVRVAHGRLQILTSVGLSVFNRFCWRRMVDYRFLASVGLAQARPNYIIRSGYLTGHRLRVLNLFSRSL